jgi:hypothetical protein
MATKMAMARVMKVAGDKESKGSKAMAMATRVAGKQTATAKKRAMSMATREVDEEEDNGKGNKSNDNGDKEGLGKEEVEGKQGQQPQQ